jgi:multiple sugar transport system permease protein
VIIGLWGVGGTMIIFLAGLQAVPQEVYEAARIDGAGALATFWNMTLPMISPIIFLQLVLQLTGAFQAFNQAKVLTDGGPNFATNLFMYKIYKDGLQGAFPQVGYATAEVWILFIIILAITALTFRTSSTWVYGENNVD